MAKLLILLLIVIFLSIIGYVYCHRKGYIQGEVIFFSMAVLSLIASIGLHMNFSREKEIQEIKNNAEKITFYIDGVKINYDNIDLNQYKISYDKELKKVFLTK